MSEAQYQATNYMPSPGAAIVGGILAVPVFIALLIKGFFTPPRY